MPSTHKGFVGLDQILRAQRAGVGAQSVILADAGARRPADLLVCEHIGAASQLQITQDTITHQQCHFQDQERGSHFSSSLT